MAENKEVGEVMQIRWIEYENEPSMLGFQVPFDTQIVKFDTETVHETWKRFLFQYGVKQHAKDGIASLSFSPSDEQKAEISKLPKEERKAKLKEFRAEYLKKECWNIRAALFANLKEYTSEMTEKAKKAKETKAQIEARVKEETRLKMLEGMRASLKAQGMSDEVIEVVLKNAVV